MVLTDDDDDDDEDDDDDDDEDDLCKCIGTVIFFIDDCPIEYGFEGTDEGVVVVCLAINRVK